VKQQFIEVALKVFDFFVDKGKNYSSKR